MAAIGFALFFLGAAGMDSERMFVPAMMVLGGMALIWMTARRINGSES